MNYKILLILFFFFLIGCVQVPKQLDKSEIKLEKKYTNSGFALIFDESLDKIKKLDDRSLMIYHKSLKRKSTVKITNPKNSKSLIAEVKSNNQKFSDFYNSVISKRIAEDLNMPVIFHNRDADKDVLSILKEFPSVTGVAHCFSSIEETALKFIDLGYYISFSGNITFKNSHLPGFAGRLPLDRILVETDCPYLSPAPHRGKPNEPGRTRFVAEKLSEIFNLSLDAIANATTRNATRLFNL